MWWGVFVGDEFATLRCGFVAFGKLIADDALESLGCRLDRAFVDVRADPSAAELLRDGGGGAGTDETIEDEVVGAGGRFNNSFD